MEAIELKAGCFIGKTYTDPGPCGMYSGQCITAEPLLALYLAWFNKQMEPIGKGDVSCANVRSLMERLADGELFVLRGIVASPCSLTLLHQGGDGDIQCVISRGRCCAVDGFRPNGQCPFPIEDISRATARQMILAAAQQES